MLRKALEGRMSGSRKEAVRIGILRPPGKGVCHYRSAKSAPDPYCFCQVEVSSSRRGDGLRATPSIAQIQIGQFKGFPFNKIGILEAVENHVLARAIDTRESVGFQPKIRINAELRLEVFPRNEYLRPYLAAPALKLIGLR